MRTLTAAEQSALQAAIRRNGAVVEIQNGDGTWIDYTAWLEEVDLGPGGLDRPVADLRLDLRRDRSPAASNSLAPFMESSVLNVLDDGVTYSPAIDVNRGIRVRLATVAAGTTPGAPDLHPVFRGLTRRVEWESSPIRVQAKDLGAALEDRWLEEVRTYGSEDGTPIEDVAQAILDDWMDGEVLYGPNGTAVDPFPVADSPLFLIRTYDAGEVSVRRALEDLGQLIGWIFAYRWNEDVGDFVLTFYEPDRAKSVPDWTFGPSRYIDVSRLNIDLQDVRNAIPIDYSGGSTEVVDAASIARYGRRWMKIVEGDDSPIDTEAEALAMANAALGDLKDPKAEQEIVLPLFWPVEVGDLYRFSANGAHYDTDQDWAVVGYRHRITTTEERTTITVRGSVAGMYSAWLRRARSGGGSLPIALLDLRPIRETETTKTYGWIASGSVAEVWIYQRLAAQDTLDPWPDAATVEPTILSGVSEYTFDIPPRDQVRYVIVEPRSADLRAGEQWRVKIDPLDPEPPVIELDDSETGTLGTQWVGIQTRGIEFSSVEFQTQVGSGPASAFGAPTRRPGDTSLVRGGTLGTGEYEHDVELAADRLSWIIGKVVLETGESLVLGPFGFDRNTQPTFISVRVTGTTVEVTADSDTESIKVERVDGGGAWSRHRDGQAESFDLSKTGDAAEAGITAGETWTVRVTAYDDPKADAGAGSLTTTQDVTVSSGAGAGEPTWDDVLASAPSPGSADATVTLDANPEAHDLAVEGYVAKVFERFDEGLGWSTFEDVTASLTPALTTPPDTATGYTRTTLHSRILGSHSTGEPLVRYEWRCEIRTSGGTVVATQTVAASWYTDSPVPE